MNALLILLPFLIATNSSAALLPPPAGPSAGEAALRMLGSLMLVAALFYGALALLRKYKMVPSSRAGSSGLKVCECRSIGMRQSLLVVAYAEKRFLVAATPAGINLLTTLPDETELKQEPETIPSPNFGQLFFAALQKRNWS